MNWIRSIGEGILITLFIGIISKKKPELRVASFVLVVIYEIFSVVWNYAGQEESAFFFWHAYLVLTVVNLADYATYKRAFGSASIYEKFFLWPFIIIPVMSGFILTVGWLIKLYRYNFLEMIGLS